MNSHRKYFLHSEAPKALCSLSCSRLSKLLDLKADSSGGPNRLSEPDAVELNLVKKRREWGGRSERERAEERWGGEVIKNRRVGVSERELGVLWMKKGEKNKLCRMGIKQQSNPHYYVLWNCLRQTHCFFRAMSPTWQCYTATVLPKSSLCMAKSMVWARATFARKFCQTIDSIASEIPSTQTFPMSDSGVCVKNFPKTNNLTFPPTSHCDWPAVWRWKHKQGLNFSLKLCISVTFHENKWLKNYHQHIFSFSPTFECDRSEHDVLINFSENWENNT